MSAIEARGVVIVERARARAVARVAARLVAELPDRHVAASEDRVTISGRGVLRDPRLMWIGSLLR